MDIQYDPALDGDTRNKSLQNLSSSNGVSDVTKPGEDSLSTTHPAADRTAGSDDSDTATEVRVDVD